MLNNKYSTGLVIGRFQPFHKGHEYLFEKAFEHCDKVIIGIGSANRHNKNNPWTARERRGFLMKFIENKRYEDKILRIINIDDHPDDDVWFENLTKKTGPFDVTLGNNDWNNGIIERHGIKAIYTGIHNREEFEGFKIRKLMCEKKLWKQRVPTYLQDFIRSL